MMPHERPSILSSLMQIEKLTQVWTPNRTKGEAIDMSRKLTDAQLMSKIEETSATAVVYPSLTGRVINDTYFCRSTTVRTAGSST